MEGTSYVPNSKRMELQSIATLDFYFAVALLPPSGTRIDGRNAHCVPNGKRMEGCLCFTQELRPMATLDRYFATVLLFLQELETMEETHTTSLTADGWRRSGLVDGKETDPLS